MTVREVKVCLLGDIGVGKSSLVGRFVHNSFNPNLTTTLGASFMSKSLTVDSSTIKFQIWDTAGQERYRSLLPMYYRNAAAAIVVYDITSEGTFDVLQEWITELHRLGPPNIVLAIAGNKCDLEDKREAVTHLDFDCCKGPLVVALSSGTMKLKIPYSRGEQYAQEVNAIFVETSALEATNVEEVFVHISRKLPPETNTYLPSGQSLLRASSKDDKKKCSGCGNG